VLAHTIVRGGWPASVGASENIARRRVADYVEAVINAAVSRVDGVEKKSDAGSRSDAFAGAKHHHHGTHGDALR
jgi:hypothetical protein